MKKCFLVLLCMYIGVHTISAENWMTSFEEARKVAMASNKLILIDFWATWCKPCKQMDTESWSHGDVQALMKDYVPVKMDIGKDKSLSRKYAIRAIPHVFIVDANGEVVYESRGYMGKSEVKEMLQKYAISTKGIQANYFNYYKRPNGNAALQIAEKYFDLAIVVSPKIKRNFLKLGSEYLRKARRLYKSEGTKGKEGQRIGLLDDVYKELISGKSEKANKLLERKFIETEIEPKNKELYYFLKLAVYSKLDKKEAAKIYYKKLKQGKEFKKYLLKYRKI